MRPIFDMLPPWASSKLASYEYTIQKCIKPRHLFSQECRTEEERKVYNIGLGLIAAREAEFSSMQTTVLRIFDFGETPNRKGRAPHQAAQRAWGVDAAIIRDLATRKNAAAAAAVGAASADQRQGCDSLVAAE
mmetsp:Transcript_4622/g.7907  ORF Transcript_4622/g.7907 Transcript_4622/m.7907 type:complete len:133 (-) Transcript_4622:117-515(-)